MNKDNNNFGNQPNGNNKTRSFTNTSKIESDNSAIKVDTDVNIKKATVKRKVKKGVFGTLFVVKKAFQWTFNVILTVLLIGTITSIIVGCAGYIYVQNHLVVDDFDIDPTELREALSQTSWIYYDEEYGDEYAPIELYGTENRMWVTYDQIPENSLMPLLPSKTKDTGSITVLTGEELSVRQKDGLREVTPTAVLPLHSSLSRT